MGVYRNCLYAHKKLRVCVCTFAHVPIYSFINIHMSFIYTHTCIHSFIHIHIAIHLYTYIYSFIYTHTYMRRNEILILGRYAYIHVYTYIHHTHTYTQNTCIHAELGGMIPFWMDCRSSDINKYIHTYINTLLSRKGPLIHTHTHTHKIHAYMQSSGV